MEHRKKSDDAKIVAGLVCLFIGFAFVWNVAVHVTDIYELHLDAETCEKVKVLGLVPSSNCVFTAPYRTVGVAPVGYVMMPEGDFIQVSPLAANRTSRTAEWSTSMKVQFGVAVVFWAATLALLFSALREKN
jgi:hypothetical protein